ncbi:DNA-directed RNA polymerase subunit P [Candidatus Woesearchaeota archaeon]|nr:DNA-directed RNA polymerase subunit P [Candidatus Woesearchaeota archaeon]
MASYKCFDCEKEVKSDYIRKKIRCPYCGSKILYKVRSAHKILKAE